MKLRRRLFGYRLEDLSELLAGRDRMFAEANRRVQVAEDKLADARSNMNAKDREIAALHGQLDDVNERLQSMTDQSAELDVLRRRVLDVQSDSLTRVVAGDLILEFLVGEVAPVLRAAEESAAALLEHADVASGNRLQEVERAREEVRTQIDLLMSWRDRVEPLLTAVQERMAETRARIEEIPDRIREALLPVAESMTSANAELGELVRAATPPPLSNRGDPAVAPEEDAVYVDSDVAARTEWSASEDVEEQASPEHARWGT